MTAFFQLNAWNYGTDMNPDPKQPTNPVYVNAHLVSTVHFAGGEEGGSLIRMQSGATLIVQESPEEVVARAELP